MPIITIWVQMAALVFLFLRGKTAHWHYSNFVPKKPPIIDVVVLFGLMSTVSFLIWLPHRHAGWNFIAFLIVAPCIFGLGWRKDELEFRRLNSMPE